MRYFTRAKFRVKIKSLSDEARIIREEERSVSKKAPQKYPSYFNTVEQYHDSLRGSLREHRVTVVRQELRATFLAYAFLRGVPYERVERPGSKFVDRKAVLRICRSLGGGLQPTSEEDLVNWLSKAEAYVAAC